MVGQWKKTIISPEFLLMHSGRWWSSRKWTNQRYTMKIIDVSIPLATPSQNEWQYRHWSFYRKIKKKWFDILMCYVGMPGIHVLRLRELGVLGGDLLLPRVKRKLTIICHRPRLLDMQNFIGGTKPILDCLIEPRPSRGGVTAGLGWFVDDRIEFMDNDWQQYQRTGTPTTQIIIETIGR